MEKVVVDKLDLVQTVLCPDSDKVDIENKKLIEAVCNTDSFDDDSSLPHSVNVFTALAVCNMFEALSNQEGDDVLLMDEFVDSTNTMGVHVKGSAYAQDSFLVNLSIASIALLLDDSGTKFSEELALFKDCFREALLEDLQMLDVDAIVDSLDSKDMRLSVDDASYDIDVLVSSIETHNNFAVLVNDSVIEECANDSTVTGDNGLMDVHVTVDDNGLIDVDDTGLMDGAVTECVSVIGNALGG